LFWNLSLIILLLAGGIGYYLYNLDKILEGDFARGEKLQLEGKYEDAATVFETLYDRHPGFHRAAEAIFQTGEIRNLYLHSYHEALLAYLLVERDYPDSPLAERALKQVADIYKNQLREYLRAIVIYQKLLDMGGKYSSEAQYEMADCYFRLNNFEQARIEFESFLKNFPDSERAAEVQYRVATAASLEGNLDKALDTFKLVSKNWPDSAYAVEARFGQAGVLEEREELRSALQILEDLRDVYPNPKILKKRIEQIEERIKKKKHAI